VKDTAKQLRQRLKSFGLADPAINAAWPMWWSEEAEASSSAKAELRFSLARKLGLEPRSLLDDGEEPRFIWRDEARFKHVRGESELERSGITSFAAALGTVLESSASAATGRIAHVDAIDLRDLVLRHQPFVQLVDLLSLCWSIEIPVIHLRIFPWPQKRMSAMAIRVRNRSMILLAKDSNYPADTAFYVAHELGHIALGHLSPDTAIVDLESEKLASTEDDAEEAAADRFALELLTGQASPRVLPLGPGGGARSLAHAALGASRELRIEPGTLVLCFGYSTGNWRLARAAMRHVYSSPKPVWHEVNQVALREISLVNVPEDSRSYLQAVLGQETAG
jgi:hypothetical protein